MAKVKNTQQYPVTVDGFGEVDPGQIIDVPDPESFTDQVGNWVAVDKSEKGDPS